MRQQVFTPGPSPPAPNERPAQRADPFAVVPSPFLRAVTQHVAVAWEREWGESAPNPQVRDVLLSLAMAIQRRRADPDHPIDLCARTALGQRLLQPLPARGMRSLPDEENPTGPYPHAPPLPPTI